MDKRPNPTVTYIDEKGKLKQMTVTDPDQFMERMETTYAAIMGLIWLSIRQNPEDTGIKHCANAVELEAILLMEQVRNSINENQKLKRLIEIRH